MVCFRVYNCKYPAKGDNKDDDDDDDDDDNNTVNWLQVYCVGLVLVIVKCMENMKNIKKQSKTLLLKSN